MMLFNASKERNTLWPVSLCCAVVCWRGPMLAIPALRTLPCRRMAGAPAAADCAGGSGTGQDIVARLLTRHLGVAMGTPGHGSLPHLMGELMQQAEAHWTHMPHTSGAPALNDLMGGFL